MATADPLAARPVSDPETGQHQEILREPGRHLFSSEPRSSSDPRSSPQPEGGPA
jgi:hypothetical protein